MQLRFAAALGTILLALVAASGCAEKTAAGGGGGSAPPAASGFGFLEVRVIDAPFPAACFAEASITIDGFELQESGQTGESGFISVTTTAQTFNLLDLVGGRSAVLGTAVVPAGAYNRVRFGITEAVLTWNDGTGYQRRFQIPPQVVKVYRPANIVVAAGALNTVTLDFDLTESFKQSGAYTTNCQELKPADKLSFSPSVRVINHLSMRMLNGIITDGRTGGGFANVTIGAKKADAGPSVTPHTTISGDGIDGAPVGFYVLYIDPTATTVTFEAPGRVTRTATISGPRDSFETLNVTIN
jgi:hypothetical protein